VAILKRKLYIFFAVLVYSNIIFAQQTYIWNVAGGGDFQLATNWTPNRNLPATNDVLVFNNGISASINNVPNQTIGQLQVSNNTSVTLVKTGAGVELTTSTQVTIDAGSLLAFDGTLRANGPVSINGSYQINEGGYATGSGTWTYGPSATLVFNNSSSFYEVNNDVYWPVANGPVNVTVQNAGGIKMNVSRTISGLFQTSAGATSSNNLTFNGTCQINNGGYLDLPPTYGPSSTLVYNPGVVYGRGNEWSATTGPGYPNNVTINAGSELNLGYGGTNTPRQLSGNLLVNGGLYMDYFSDDMTQPLTVLGNITIGNNGTISLSDLVGGDLKVQGNWTRSGSGIFNPRNRAVFFEGPSGDQSITGTTTFDYLLITKAAGNVELNSPVTVNQLLTLTSGKIYTSSTNLLTLTDNASYAGGSINSFVSGPMKKIGDEDFVFPVGLTSIYAPVGLTGGSNAAVTDEFTVEYLRTNPQSVYGNTYLGTINHISYVEHWLVERSLTSTASKNVSLDVHQTSFCLVPSTTFVSRYNGTAWTQEASTAGTFTACGAYQCGTITTNTPITTFSPFTLATTDPFAVNPLPMKLISFSASRIAATHAVLNWELAACCSREAQFEIQKSLNQRDYYTIATQPGSEVNRFYSYHDTRLSGNKTFYRLKITEPEGKVTYSQVVVILQNSDELLITSLWPNPATDKVQLSISSGVNTKGQLILLNMAGQVVLQQNITLAEGSRIQELELTHLPAGIYSGSVQAGTRRAVFRVVKN
jgi:hypothetical protein